ncbi:hypothetical protein [Hungatella effluvii]|uniref:hypothetical protein n=1 Tax=Hungatella effluvii TaxID=1096246 RepID=UPI0022E80C25|nr:hypothetical protein [Hungatella effluvii]
MLKVNGRSYSWGDVDLKIPGLDIEVQEISYDDELEKEAQYGRGQMSRGYGEGNYKASGKISLLRDDFDTLLDYCRRTGTPLYRLLFPKIAVSYANDGGRTRTDILNKVTITKLSQKAAQGDKSLKVDLDLLIVGDIKRDGVAAI